MDKILKEIGHCPVLLKEVIDFLEPLTGDVIVDGTVGTGGHSEEVLKRIKPNGFLIGIDKDNESLKIASDRLKLVGCDFKLVHRDFRYIKEILQDVGIKKVGGILFDFGISSFQIDTQERGFSIKDNGPLDMRMDRTGHLTARYLVNRLSEDEISLLIKDLGEERFYRRIARGIAIARRQKEIQTTAEFSEIILKSIPYKGRSYSRGHPATRTFQAFRIKVNNELDSIEEVLKIVPSILNKGGRVCVISFHSLEDRLVKKSFKNGAMEGMFRIITNKPLVPSEEEIFINPRARSAKLRVAERL